MAFPYTEIEFQKDGSVHDHDQVQAALDLIRTSGATDVLVVSHGWNNNIPAARRLYSGLMESMDAVRGEVPGAAGRTIAVLGILWPSIQWADDVAGGGAGFGDAAGALVDQISDRVEDPAAAAELTALVDELDTSAAARARFLEILRGLLPEGLEDDEDAPPETLIDGTAETAFDAARSAGDLSGDEAGGGAAGFSIGGFIDAARNLLNTTTYYTMKGRAGVVGTKGVAPVLRQIADAAPTARIHLAGHSFGARVVTAAALATTAPVSSVSLLQGAYSHYGLAQDWDGRGTDGSFRRVPGKIRGPLIVTHTRNDKAVGLAYAIASRLARQVGAGLGDSSDVYGGIGRNGALKTPEAGPPDTLRRVGTTYAFAPGTVTNLRADDYIANHSDVTGREVAYAVVSALVTG